MLKKCFEIFLLYSAINFSKIGWKSFKFMLKIFLKFFQFFLHHYKNGTIGTSECLSRKSKHNVRGREHPL